LKNFVVRVVVGRFALDNCGYDVLLFSRLIFAPRLLWCSHDAFGHPYSSAHWWYVWCDWLCNLSAAGYETMQWRSQGV